MADFITACPRNCYSTCTFIVQTENNRIRRILPYRQNRATPEGPCIKGLSYIERSRSSDRIIHPLFRSDDGRFHEISPDNALDIIAEKFSLIRKNHGPLSVLWYRGSGNSGLINETGNEFWKQFGGATTTYGNLCWTAGLEAVRLTMGPVKHNVPRDIAYARVVLAPGIASVLVNDNLTDNRFIELNVIGFDQFREHSLIAPERAAGITGIPAIVIHELAHN